MVLRTFCSAVGLSRTLLVETTLGIPICPDTRIDPAAFAEMWFIRPGTTSNGRFDVIFPRWNGRVQAAMRSMSGGHP